MDEPGKLAQMRGVKNVEFALREISIQHPSMLPEATLNLPALKGGDS